MAPRSLLGPPELHKPSPTTTAPPPPQPESKPATGEPFVDLMVANFNDVGTKHDLPMGLTENASATFLSTGNPCLDLFFHVVPNTPADYLTEQLPKAWDRDALTTLKLICNLRGVRGTGKSDKEGFHTAAFWLHKHHPKTLACNLASFAEFGYFKDLPEIVYRLLEGEDVRKKQKAEWRERKRGGGRKRRESSREPGSDGETGSRSEKKRIRSEVPKEEREKKAKEWQKGEKAKASGLRKEKKIAMAKKVVVRYERDPDFRFLHDRVSDLFAECLKSDMENLKSNQLNKITLAAKWCPSIDSSFDRATLICESIAKKIFPRESNKEYEGVEESHYAYRVRDRLRKEVLVPLRKALELPEIYMGANQWGKIPYNRVASVAMKLYKDKFKKHDEERFNKYLEDVKAGKAKIAAGALLPHEIIESLNDGEGDDGQVAELQWRRMVEDMLKLGKMNNCLAVCDVSGSMSGTPMEVAVALGLLVSELSEDPWKGLVISFSADPQLHLVKGESLKDKTDFIRNMDWGMNTDFQKVFDLLLKVAVKGNLKPENMIKRLFVFSDMEFDQASANEWETDYEVIENKFKEAGYGDVIPQLVFWNLRHSRSIPVPGNQKGTALLSGFSKNLLKLFMDNDGEVQPDMFMDLAIAGPEYQKLVVLD
ncbi:hypothetical protein RchiOBHm_Chr4g0429291 [Rosa chinensis]|uniref:von Willebrand factor, type A n=1 Tax=Rosa chinensis TaxID=74649 RepID=A0A2P6R054_ROSCH|nr:uncharacterized protein LOC112200007 [Rosa chinensis]PRQ39811.1 hypothetical protein RchiOBHm_Chr4g0429291 [Rosa chinensis]